jgi:hypothetical protein
MHLMLACSSLSGVIHRGSGIRFPILAVENKIARDDEVIHGFLNKYRRVMNGSADV